MKKESKEKYYILILLISVLVASPLLVRGFFVTHDGNFHINRVVGTIQSIKDGQILPMIIPNFVNGFGYGSNMFYPPISNFLPIILLVGTLGNVLDAFKLMIFIAIVMSGINMFNLMYDITKSKKTSLIIAIIYLTVPYKIIDIYVRMAVGEILAFVFIPLVFQGIYDIINSEGNKWYLFVIGMVGLLLSHNISTLLISACLLIYLIFYFTKILKKKKIVKLLICLTFIIGMTLFFYIPFFEVMQDSQYYVEYYDNKINLKEHSLYLYEPLMGKTNNNYLYKMSDDNKANEDICLAIGLHVLIPLLFTPFVWKNIKKENKNLYLLTLIIGIVSIIATTNLFPWDKMQDTLIGFIQFPMRMLIISTFTLSIIAGINVSLLLEDKKSMKDVMFFILIVLIYVQPIINLVNFDTGYTIESAYEIEDIAKLEGKNSEKCSEFEYLPINAINNFEYIKNRNNEIIVLQGNTTVSEQKKDGTTMKVSITNTIEDTIMEFPYIYYKGYCCRLNDKNIEVFESENGMVAIKLPKNSEGILEIEYKGTILAYISLVISVTTFFIFIIYIIICKKRNINKVKVRNRKNKGE